MHPDSGSVSLGGPFFLISVIIGRYCPVFLALLSFNLMAAMAMPKKRNPKTAAKMEGSPPTFGAMEFPNTAPITMAMMGNT